MTMHYVVAAYLESLKTSSVTVAGMKTIFSAAGADFSADVAAELVAAVEAAGSVDAAIAQGAGKMSCAAAAPVAAATSAAAAPTAAAPAKEEEESDDDMGFSLFD